MDRDASNQGRGAGASGAHPGSEPWFGVPSLPLRYASRPRLLSLLESGRDAPLVLVSAPAGTGKTSLVADWVRTHADPDRTEWVTCEADDGGFWPGLVRSLERLGVEMMTRPSLHAGVMSRRGLLSVATALAGLPDRVTVVLDGYEMASVEVATDIDFLLRHANRHLRLVLVTRVDPVLPLYRYRLDDTVTELRMADLAFTDDEAAELLDRCGLGLTEASVQALNSRTMGWAVGLRFAAQILTHRSDPDQGAAEVTGDAGNIAEYLLGEVLESQAPEVRRLLLCTCIPDTLQPGLVEELGGRSARWTLYLLTRGNAFIEPVPQQAGSYRYHPLFRDLLRARLAYEAPELMQRMQRRTAEWYAHQGRTAEAVRHYAAVDAWEDAATAVVDGLAVGELLLTCRSAPMAASIADLPDDVSDHAACVVRATLAIRSGDLDRAGDQLDAATRSWVRTDGPHDRAFALALAVLRVVRERLLDDPRETLTRVEEAELLLDARENHAALQQHPELVALVMASKGHAEACAGRLDAAYEAFSSGAEAAAAPGAECLLFECLGQMAVLACFTGRVALADELATRAVEVAEYSGLPAAGRTTAHSALAWVSAERDDLRQGQQHVESAEHSDPAVPDPVVRTLLTVAKARLEAARGHVPRALLEIDEVSAALHDRQDWMSDRLRIEKSHLRVVNGEPDAALLELKDVRSQASGDAQVTLVAAQAHLQRGDEDAAATSLASALAQDAPVNARTEAWLVEAARQLHRGSRGRARTAVRRALRLAAHDTLRRPFAEAPSGVRQLISSDPELRSESSWLVADAPRSAQDHLRRSGLPLEQEPAPDLFPVVEELTPKELEVLGYLAELLTTEEIAGAMFVSVNTIRTHVRNILRKLGVSRRNAAVRRARDLDLLPA